MAKKRKFADGGPTASATKDFSNIGRKPSWAGAGRNGRDVDAIGDALSSVGRRLAPEPKLRRAVTGSDAGMDSTGTIAALNKSNKSPERIQMKGDLPVGVSTGAAPAAPKPKAAAPKPKVVAPRPRRAAADDGFLADLRASAARMKDATSEAAGATSKMRGAMSDFDQSFKKGGSVKSRGDGIAQRGKTKGRFI